MKIMNMQNFARLCAVAIMLIPLCTSAAVDPNTLSPLRAQSIWELLNQILDAVVLIIFPIVVLMIVYTGFMFITAQGNPAKISAARTALLWTVVGALVVLGAKALSLAIEATVLEIRGNTAGGGGGGGGEPPPPGPLP